MLAQFITLLNSRLDLGREEGQGMAEYALIIALVAVLLVTALGALQGGISSTLSTIATSLGYTAP